MLQKIKNIFLKKNEKQEKLNQLLDSLDDVRINKDSIVIKFNKNLVCYSEGHQLFFSKGDIAIKSTKLHLNPDVQISEDAKLGNSNKIIKNIHRKNDKMAGIAAEVIEDDKELIEEENSGCC